LRLYCFWIPVPEEKFHLKNHVQEISFQDGKIIPGIPNSKISALEFLRLKTLLLEETFAPAQSPWIMYIARNVVHEKYGQCDTLIFKWYHGIADGISIINMFAELFTPKFAPPQIHFPRVPAWVDVAMRVRAFFNIFDIKLFGKSSVGKSIIAPSASQLAKSFYLAESDPIPIGSIKGVKNKNSVSFNSVVLTALSSALRSYVIQKGEENTKIPKEISTCIILPYPGHPDEELTNYWSYTIIPLPVAAPPTGGEGEMLQKIFQMINGSKENVFKNFWRIPLFGRLPFLFHRHVVSPNSIAFSDFPGPAHRSSMWDSEVLHMSFHIILLQGLSVCFLKNMNLIN